MPFYYSFSCLTFDGLQDFALTNSPKLWFGYEDKFELSKSIFSLLKVPVFEHIKVKFSSLDLA